MPKKKAKDRQRVGEKTEGTISRRSVLKIGAAAGATTVLAPSLLNPGKALAFQDPIPEPATRCVNTVPATPSPAHHPFVQNFAAPFPAIPTDLDPAPQEFRNEGAGE